MFLAFATMAYAVTPVTITTPDGSDAAFVNDGAVPTSDRARHKKSITGSGQIYNGTCWLQSIAFYSNTTGDLIGVYDSRSGSMHPDWLELEIGLSANNVTEVYDSKGAYYENGIAVWSTNTNAKISVIYDY